MPTAPLTARGLSASEAAQALAVHGPNELRKDDGPSAWRILAGQFSGAMIWLLIGASVVSAVVGEVLDATAIAVIVVLNAAIGFAQEHRAERAMHALRALGAPRARVLRDDRITMLRARDVVPGDVLVLEAGDVIAADAELVEAHALSTNEAALTGESAPVEKRAGATASGVPLAERTGSVFLGTSIATGTGRARVRATGMRTELGRIADLVATAKTERTPLEKRLEQVGRTLLVGCLAIVGIVAALGLVRGEPWLEVLVSSISLAVAAVPEGLAAIVTIALAIGVQRMASRNVLVRRLPAVETLGTATVICTDKTGTLTTGRMRVREVWGDDHDAVVDAAAACCDAELDTSGQDGTGDATEIAILIAAAERGIHRADVERTRARLDVLPFDADRKRMSIVRADGHIYVKGAPESVLAVLADDRGAERVRAANAEMAARGLRVLAVAVGDGREERDLRLLGLIGIADPPRSEAIEAIAAARRAGIRTIMITGDQALTAHAIARELGLIEPGESPDECVHARATPDDKLRIVRAWKERGQIVAMTGDGVNDAPALREAHIGIAMGKTGTDVAREAAAMVLTDDDFASIVAAVREGRGIFDNIRKTLVYLLSGNLAELAFVLATSLLGMPLPLTALQILWINLVTDGLPALALVMDPAAADVLEHPPRPVDEPMLGAREWKHVAFVALIEAGVVLGVYAWALAVYDRHEARTLAFSVLVFSEVVRSFTARSDTRTFFETGALSNLRLVAVVVCTVFVQLTIHQLPLTETLFDIRVLTLPEALVALGVGLVPATLVELTKLGRRAVVAGRARHGEAARA